MTRVRCIRAPHFLLASLLVFGALGCGGQPSRHNGTTGTVSGTIKRKGEVATDKLTVTFLSSDGGIVATGSTDATGFYSLTYEKSRNIPTGTYKVSLAPFVPPPDPNQDPSQFMDPVTGMTKIPEAPKVAFPAKYANPGTSGIVRDVESGPNTIDINAPD